MNSMRKIITLIALVAALAGGLEAHGAAAKKTAAKTAKKQAAKTAPKGPNLMEAILKGEQNIVPCRALTQGPTYHWFSYYDVNQFDPTGRYVLAMAVGFECRQPVPSDVVTIGMIDLKENDKWTTLGTTTAWCWQQGCRLQWRPGSDREVMWNDRENGHYICRVLDVKSGARRTLPYPIDHLSPDGKWALTADFARTVLMRPAYGYQGIADPAEQEKAPATSGVWKMNLDSGERTMLISVADVAKIISPGYTPESSGRHYINHLGWAPDGKHFLFLNRGEKVDRMFTADADGKNLKFICNAPSHFTWRDAQTIVCWTANAYRIYAADGSSGIDGKVLFNAVNGHQTYLAGGEWLLTDTYPQSQGQGPEKQRFEYIYLYHVPDGKITVIGKFDHPERYSVQTKGEPYWRCDLHPRISPDETKVTIDSVCNEKGRQIYLLDIGGIIGKKK